MESSYPKLKFSIDKEFDEWACKEFLTYDENNIFSNSILRGHPKLIEGKPLNDKERIDFFNQYIDKYYKEHIKELEAAKEWAENNWKRIELRFYELVSGLFAPKNNTKSEYIYTWPEGNYICAISIFNCNPRFIEDKDFQAFYNHHEGIKSVCVHEMLHFAFYDYIERQQNDVFKSLGDSGTWKLSEIFNDVVLRDSEFVKITGIESPGIYAQSDEELPKYIDMWKRSKNVHNFTKAYINNF